MFKNKLFKCVISNEPGGNMRNKLRLQVDELAVESFSTADSGENRGTVKAHSTEGFEECLPFSASVDYQCICQADEPTYDTTCNPHYCYCQQTFVGCTRREC